MNARFSRLLASACIVRLGVHGRHRPFTARAVSLAHVLMILALAGMMAASVPDSAAKPIVSVGPVQTKNADQKAGCESFGGRFHESTNALGTAGTTLCVADEGPAVVCTNTVFTFECQAVRTTSVDQPGTGHPDTAENVNDSDVTGPSEGADVQVVWDPTGTTADPTDPRIDLMIAMCHDLGGIETRSTTTTTEGSTRTNAFVCQGGDFDTFGCATGESGAWCAFGLSSMPEAGAIAPGESIALPVITDLAVDPVTVEELGTDVDIVVYNQQGPTVSDNAWGQSLVCRMLGGLEGVTTDRTPGGGVRLVAVRCLGSVVGDWICVNIVGFPTVCGARIQMPGSPVITPVPDKEQPDDSAPPSTDPAIMPSPTVTTEPTVPPVEPTIPTVEPTDVPVEPTAEPPDVFPTLPGDSVNPPDTAEQPTPPTPTPVPIG